MEEKVSIFWFRRDLRLDDNVGLAQALKNATHVLPIFIFDKEILLQLPKNDARVTFIHQTLTRISERLKKDFNSSLGIYHGQPLEVFESVSKDFNIEAVYTNHDYEPYAIKRDKRVQEFLEGKSIPFHTYKDQVIFEKEEVVKNDGDPYVVYTPYKNKWKEKFNSSTLSKQIKDHKSPHNFIANKNLPFLTLEQIGFETSDIKVPDFTTSEDLIDNYEATRNFPGIDNGTSRIGPHLRFGTVSIRKIVTKAIASKNEVFWNELIWREFFMQILWHFPHTINNAFKRKYDRIPWRNNEEEYEKWKHGQTGYPLVDAGMRELNATGYMHNRVRMLVASFLCKHLLIDWRWGEAYFAEKLLDFELSSNVGNWQWAAGSGVDAAPYFRIFNPTTQIDKFDKKHEYINQWVPELQELTYPSKMVDHKMARERCLKVYKEALG
ncbi:deoxyribodipyrimidine photo-lyase [Maribacter sp. TH_r10]|uniref:cryptochrome/photolyase family protein n=1 Tax=Maribacter sp. TH_r10 TaxID=3082086 RepID=UPI002953E116|nr:deoxyribodipyrimidine photo-lyase [Maribacter sp. TH_r10]MDV7138959.1 deoxyribodipyrimidine photo-lyase [Maribacter sp. TH_r10]